VKKAFDEYGKGFQWFQSAIRKYDITQDRRLTLGGKAKYSAYMTILTRFPEFLILGLFQMDRERLLFC
jgi:hypothetical protein